jgi:hypothetical protein
MKALHTTPRLMYGMPRRADVMLSTCNHKSYTTSERHEEEKDTVAASTTEWSTVRLVDEGVNAVIYFLLSRNRHPRKPPC